MVTQFLKSSAQTHKREPANHASLQVSALHEKGVQRQADRRLISFYVEIGSFINQVERQTTIANTLLTTVMFALKLKYYDVDLRGVCPGYLFYTPLLCYMTVYYN